MKLKSKKIQFTQIELKVINFLIENKERHTSPREIFEHILGFTTSNADEAIKSHIKNIMYKFEVNDKNPKKIKYLKGSGYKILLPK